LLSSELTSVSLCVLDNRNSIILYYNSVIGTVLWYLLYLTK